MLLGTSINEDGRSECKLSVSSSAIAYTKLARYIGVYIDENLKFDIHVNRLTAKLAKLIGWLGRLKQLSQKAYYVVYAAYILPNLDYACTIWRTTKTNIRLVQRLQNRAA